MMTKHTPGRVCRGMIIGRDYLHPGEHHSWAHGGVVCKGSGPVLPGLDTRGMHEPLRRWGSMYRLGHRRQTA